MSAVLLAQGNAIQIPLRDKSVQCCVCSPPYLGLRLYNGVEPTVWGGDPACTHTWKKPRRTPKRGHAGGKSTLVGTQTAMLSKDATDQGSVCLRCGAWRGMLGNEIAPDCFAWARGAPPCPFCYTCHLRTIFAQVWRVLRDDGTLWLNIADSFSSGGRGTSIHHQEKLGFATATAQALGRKSTQGFKPKNLLGIPWRVALALQQDGWILRSDIIWEKPSCMPESVRDRFTRSHEYLFLFAKRARYYFDQDAMRESYSAKGLNDAVHAYGYGLDSKMHQAIKDGVHGAGGLNDPTITRDTFYQHGGRNARTVWRITSKGYPGAHYATFPAALVEKCILAGTSEHGCCPACQAPYVRQTAVDYVNPGNRTTNGPRSLANRHQTAGFAVRLEKTIDTAGWAPGCSCNAGPPRPCIVCDPFIGSGTTALVARALGRHAVGLDLSYPYLRDQARPRLQLDALAAWEGRENHQPHETYEDLPLFQREEGRHA